MRAAEPERGEPKEALERVLLATWQQLSQFHSVLAINISRLSTKELHRRHLPMTTQFVPLIERGQAEGVFRGDVSAAWLIAVDSRDRSHGEHRAASRTNLAGRRRAHDGDDRSRGDRPVSID